MSSMWGADLGRLEEMERQMRSVSARLSAVQVSLRGQIASSPWRGPSGDQFRQAWDRDIRPTLLSAAQQLNAAADTMRRNRLAQQGTSAAEASPILAGSRVVDPGMYVGGTGTFLRSLDDSLVTPLGAGATAWGHLAGSAGLGATGNTFAAFSAFTSGFGIGESLASQQYIDAGIQTAFVGGDITASALKAGHTPVSYVGGVALQTWVEVGREATKVDWSAEGMRDIQKASLGDWSGALGGAASQMPLKLIKIFSF